MDAATYDKMLHGDELSISDICALERAHVDEGVILRLSARARDRLCALVPRFLTAQGRGRFAESGRLHESDGRSPTP